MRDETTTAIIIRVTFFAVAIALNGCFDWLLFKVPNMTIVKY